MIFTWQNPEFWNWDRLFFCEGGGIWGSVFLPSACLTTGSFRTKLMGKGKILRQNKCKTEVVFLVGEGASCYQCWVVRIANREHGSQGCGAVLGSREGREASQTSRQFALETCIEPSAQSPPSLPPAPHFHSTVQYSKSCLLLTFLQRWNASLSLRRQPVE